MHFRSRRLQALLGVPLDEATYQHFHALLDAEEAREAEDLDYKATYAGPTKTDSIAVDVATFANVRGGVVVIGINDKNGIPSAAPGIDLTDAFEREINTAIAARVHPFPVYDVKWLPEDPDSEANPKRGIMLLAVPQSQNGPHAVSEPPSKALKWPFRIGSQKDWMTETQIAAAYRRRYATAADSEQRVAHVESDVLVRVARGEAYSTIPRPILTVSLVPEMPGEFAITQDQFDIFRKALYADPFAPGLIQAFFTAAVVGSGRYFASGPLYGHTAWTELHTDGAGSVALPLEYNMTGGSDIVGVRDSEVVLFIVSALRFLAQHAVDRAGASGTAVATARILPDVLAFDATERSLILAIRRQLDQRPTQDLPYNPQAAVIPVTVTGLSSGRESARDAYGQSVVFLEDLAGEGRPLIAAAGELSGKVLQAYGLAEPRQIRPGGTLAPVAWERFEGTARELAVKFDIPIV